MTLLSLASKQVWPHILSVTQIKPERLVLLHSDDANESRLPAQRLKRFFDRHGPVPQGRIKLEPLSDSDFSSIERRLDELTAAQSWNLAECVMNVTGGNKLMATAAFRWAARRGVRTFYLERRNKITWFDFRDGEIITTSDTLNGHVTDGFDPVALLRCQVDASEVEREGETLTLNRAAQDMDADKLFTQLGSGGDAQKHLDVSGTADRDVKVGDSLEYITAAILLKLGVRRVQRSLRLKVKSAPGVGTNLPHAEIDLLFTWDGKLWLVDCKDRKSPESLIKGLRQELTNQILSQQAKDLLARISKELSIGQTKVMKEDLIAVHETGGLLGQVVCVRKTEPDGEVAQFAKHNKVEIVPKSRLTESWLSLLFPNAKPDAAQLQDLASAFQR